MDVNFLKIDNAWKLFGFILILNLFQSALTPLLNDEPYYWVYSQYLNWGYFDHPPMIAFLIKLGTALLPGELGVRFFSAILGSFTFFFLYKIIEEEAPEKINFKLVILLLGSSIFLNLYSFLAIPDTPMLFFATVFLYIYRKYLKKDSFLNTFTLAIVITLMLYSKYHGILLVGFTVLSNPKLFLRKSFYIVFALAAIFYLPHIYWQIQNDYPTIKFHLYDRGSEFKFRNVLSYIGEQLGVTGPVIFLMFSILYKPKNDFQKALKFNVTGLFAFFFISSFKGMVNLHWTAIAWPPMLCLAYLFITDLKTNKKLITGILIFNLVIVILFRLNFICNWFTIPHFNDKNPKLMTEVFKKKQMAILLYLKICISSLRILCFIKSKSALLLMI